MKNEYWTTEGNIRGSCGHRHRDKETATKCLKSDKKACRKLSSGLTRCYSDRELIHYIWDNVDKEYKRIVYQVEYQVMEGE